MVTSPKDAEMQARLKLIPKFSKGTGARLCNTIAYEIYTKGTPMTTMATMKVGFNGQVTDIEKFKALKNIVVEFDIESEEKGVHLVFGNGPILEVAKLPELPFVDDIEAGRAYGPL